MTNEEWLRHAVEEIDIEVFGGDLDLLNHAFQINWGRVKGSKLTETIQPSDGEIIDLDDFFPTTICVSFTIKDPMDMLTALTYECIHAFFNIPKKNKQFKQLAEKYYFEKPYKEAHPSQFLTSILQNVHKRLIKQYGHFPGMPVVFYPKEKKDGPKNTLVVFCPHCDYELKISRKMYDKYNQKLPVCVCGTKMALDLSDEEEKTID
jgi:hypothetical protein